MSKTLKIVATLLGLVVLVVILAAVILPMVVDPNDYREDIAAAAEEATGLPMAIDGDLRLSVIPWLGVQVGGARLGNPPGFGDQPMVRLGSASVGARLLPLLGGRLEISTVRLEDVDVHLVRDADGRGNWEAIGGDREATAAPGEQEGSTGGLELTGVAGLELVDARLRFEDRAAGRETIVEIPRLSTGALAPGEAFSVDGEARATLGGGEGQVGGTFKATIEPAADLSRIGVAGLELRVEGALGDGPLVFEGELDAPRAGIVLEGPSLELSGLSLRGTASAGDGVEHSVATDAPAFSLDMGAGVLSVPELSVVADGVEVTLNVDGRDLAGKPRFQGAVNVAGFSPREIMDRLGMQPPVTRDEAVLGAASASASYIATPEEVTLSAIDLRLDDTGLTGNLAVGLGDTRRVEGRLGLDAIDLDRYLPPQAQGEGQDAPAAAGDQPLSFEWLDGLVMDLSLGAGRVVVRGLTMEELNLRLRAAEQVLEASPLTAKLYGGRLTGQARLDATASPARMQLDPVLSGLSLGPFLSDLAGLDRIEGTANLKANLGTSARTTTDLVSGLQGGIAFAVTGGAYRGVNVWYEIQRAWALVKGRQAPEKASPDTLFRDVTGTAVIEDGVLVNDDFTAGLESLVLTGEGRVDLAAATLDYGMEAAVRPDAGQGGSTDAGDLAGARVPLRITGPLGSPSVSVDVKKIVRREAEKQLLKELGVESKEGQSSEEALKEKAEEKARDLLNKFLGGDE